VIVTITKVTHFVVFVLSFVPFVIVDGDDASSAWLERVPSKRLAHDPIMELE
jgi:hypothetical protein